MVHYRHSLDPRGTTALHPTRPRVILGERRDRQEFACAPEAGLASSPMKRNRPPTLAAAISGSSQLAAISLASPVGSVSTLHTISCPGWAYGPNRIDSACWYATSARALSSGVVQLPIGCCTFMNG